MKRKDLKEGDCFRYEINPNLFLDPSLPVGKPLAVSRHRLSLPSGWGWAAATFVPSRGDLEVTLLKSYTTHPVPTPISACWTDAFTGKAIPQTSTVDVRPVTDIFKQYVATMREEPGWNKNPPLTQVQRAWASLEWKKLLTASNAISKEKERTQVVCDRDEDGE